MQHNYEKMGQQMIYYMPREVDHHVADEMRQELEYQIMNGQVRKIVFDFSATEFMDSSGIGVIIGRSKTLGYFGGKVSVSHLNERLERIVRASGLSHIVEMEEN